MIPLITLILQDYQPPNPQPTLWEAVYLGPMAKDGRLNFPFEDPLLVTAGSAMLALVPSRALLSSSQGLLPSLTSGRTTEATASLNL